MMGQGQSEIPEFNDVVAQAGAQIKMVIARHNSKALHIVQGIPQNTAKSPFGRCMNQGFGCSKFLYASINLIQVLQLILCSFRQNQNPGFAVSLQVFDKIRLSGAVTAGLENIENLCLPAHQCSQIL